MEAGNMITLYQSSGHLKTSYDQNMPCLRLMVDPEIHRYYRSLLPKWMNPKKPMYPPHVSVIRREVPPNQKIFESLHGREVTFFYGEIEWSDTYIWLNVYSVELENIRIELGLPVVNSYSEPPEGFKKRFHSTLSNFK